MPCSNNSTQVSGTTALKGHRSGRQLVCSEVSLMVYAYQASLQLAAMSMMIEGKKNTM